MSFGPIGEVATQSTVQKRLNKRFDKIFHRKKDGSKIPYVCSICDEFILHSKDVNWFSIDLLKQKRNLLAWEKVLRTSERKEELENAFQLNDNDNQLSDSAFLKGMALSPRGCFGRKNNHHRSKLGISCCNRCKCCLEKDYTPFYAIVNRNYVGNAPPVLQDLSEFELSLITPVRGHGYCHTYTGGKMKNLKGTMSFLRIEERKICKATMQLVGMGLTQHVVLLLTGKMTKGQRQKVRDKCEKMRTHKIIAAVEWLCANHRRWAKVDLEAFKRELENVTPIIIDNSREEDSENTNVEDRELFTCFYPDGATTQDKAGFDDPNTFREYVNELQSKGFDPALQLQLKGEWINSEDGDMLVSACPLAFPYGICGINSRRRKADGSFTDKPEPIEYYRHLSLLSQLCFQTPMIQLILYNQISKLKLLRKSRLQVKGEHRVENLSKGINYEDVKEAIKYRKSGMRHSGTNASRALLQSVDACTKALPHTNEAAKQARVNGEAMQHHFGIATTFVTVNFDDENSILMQIYAQEMVDDDTPLKDLNDSKLAGLVMQRKAIRLNYPGLSAINFEVCLHIIMEEAIGWDLRRNCPTENPGLVGEVEALASAVEEQGRKTPHGHMTIWIKNYHKLRNAMFFGTKREKAEAEKWIRQYHDHLIGTSFFEGNRHTLAKSFDHTCTVGFRDRQLPVVVSDQQLRHLRHINGYKNAKGTFAYCFHCAKEWTYEQLVDGYCRNCGEYEETDGAVATDVTGAAIIPRARMIRRIIDFQKEDDVDIKDTPKTCINAVYNQHASNHLKNTCFRCQKTGKSSHTHGPKCECRMRLPDRARVRGAQVRTIDESKPWFEWNGSVRDQPLVELLAKRNVYDLFQNKAITAISESKFACNTNASVITDGPVSGYMIKYNFKDNQQDDSADYKHVEASIKSMGSRRHEDDKKEAIRVLCRAAFAHNRTNVIGVPLAAYLNRNSSRFYFSEQFEYCPIRDISKVLNRQPIPVIARYHGDSGDLYFENQAYHYLCRHKDLDSLCVKDFFERYQTVSMSATPTEAESRKRKRKRKRQQQEAEQEPVLRFINETASFQHPSARLSNTGVLGYARQGSKQKKHFTRLKLSQWMFSDTAKFKANMLTCDHSKITSDMEEYALLVLLLFLPFRNINDLMPSISVPKYPHLYKLREVHVLLLGEKEQRFLQNIQDSGYNSMRYKVKNDDLQSVTVPFKCDKKDWEHDDEEDEEEEEETCPYNVVLENIDDIDPHDTDPTFLPQVLNKKFSFDQIRNRGRKGVGFREDIPIPDLPIVDENNDFVSNLNQDSTDAGAEETIPDDIPKKSVKDIVRLLLSREKPRKRCRIFKNNKDVEVCDATGSIGSIAQWARAAKLDRFQKRAFESIISSFLLTFHDEIDASNGEHDADVDPAERSRYRRHKLHLLRLRGSKKSQLIMLLHGPGGSGKSTVIELVVDYAREYCEHLGHPFTRRTIVVSAMSGVAATLLKGETTHMAVGLNRSKVTDEMLKEWKDTRLLIVDEISFASEEDFDKLYKHCQDLKMNPFLPYGGLNIVLAGDFSQLEPPRKTPIYKYGRRIPSFHDTVDTFVELNGMHRFKDDEEWGHRLFRFRQGQPTLEDIRYINEHCLVDDEHVPPMKTQIATHRNQDRDAINSAIFEELCTKNQNNDNIFYGAIVILMDNLKMMDDRNNYVYVKSNAVKRHFWLHCSEDTCSKGPKSSDNKRNRVDPVVKVYPGCPMMLTENSAVSNGQANGSRVFLRRVVVKVGESSFPLKLQSGTVIRAYFASQIKHVVLEHENVDILPRTFNCAPKEHKFVAQIETDIDKCLTKMSGNQVPIISNSATTGHKLQGYTATSLLVSNWFYGQNWAYVVLSRVRKMVGLYMLEPLSEKLEKYKMPESMLKMIQDFRDRCLIENLSPDEYLSLEADLMT